MGKRAEGSPRLAVEWIYVRYSTALIILGALVLLAAGGGWYWWSQRAVDEEALAMESLAVAERRVAEARMVAPEAESLLAAEADVSRARTALDARLFGESLTASKTAIAVAEELLGRFSGNAEVGVRVVRAEGDVRVKRAGQFLWEEAGPHTVLSPGDQIRSGTSGTAQLVYFDGAVMTLSPGTLLEIRELHHDPARRERRVSEHLAWGSVSGSTREGEGIRSIHEVATESTAVVAKENSEFQVTHDRESRRSEVVAISGELKVRTAEGEVKLPEATRMRVEHGRVTETSTLLGAPRLLTPADEKTFLAPHESLVRPSWQKAEGASSYHFQLSERPLFTHLVHDQRHVGRDYVELPPLAPGSYYWRVAALDGKGHRGRWSPARKFRVLGSEFRDPEDRKPPPLDIREILVVGTTAIINGSTEPGALVWINEERVDIEDDGAFTWVVKLHDEGRNRIAFLAQDAAGNETRGTGVAHVDAF